MKKDMVEINISNKTYGKFSETLIYVTKELKRKLEKIKKRDNTDLFTNLQTRGFQGGKHLIELLSQKYGKSFKLILSHKDSFIKGNTIAINYEKFNSKTRSRFFLMYREVGLDTAIEFLRETFASDFPKGEIVKPPTKKQIEKAFDDLSQAAYDLSQKKKHQILKGIAELIERQEPQFVFALLSAIDKSCQGTSERLKVALKEIILKISKESAEAMNELSDFMDKWNLLQVTSLLSILKARLETIATFEEMIHNDKTYELKGDKSIHRTLEKSMWILDDKYWIAQSNKSLREFIGKELSKTDKEHQKKRPDFACVNSSGKVVLVEIKRPSLELTENEINQAELYLRIVKKYKSAAANPVILLVGNKISEESRELANLRGYPILYTYQDMIDNCRKRYHEYLEIVEESNR